MLLETRKCEFPIAAKAIGNHPHEPKNSARLSKGPQAKYRKHEYVPVPKGVALGFLISRR